MTYASPPPGGFARTLGALRESGHVHRSTAAEVRENLLARMGAGLPRFPGVHGFDHTVLPHLLSSLRADLSVLCAPVHGRRRRTAGALAAPGRALRRETGDPRHRYRRAGRRRRPGPAGRGPLPR